MAKFNEILRYLRTSHDITQAELAKAIGVKPSTIGMYESGVREPNFEIEEKIADYFNVSLDVLRGKKEHADDTKKFIDELKEIDIEDLNTLNAIAESYGASYTSMEELTRSYGFMEMSKPENISPDKLIKPNKLLETYKKLSPNSQDELEKYAEFLLAREKNK